MSVAASERQIAKIIRLLTRSSIPPMYQETLLNSLHSLSAQEADAVGEDLARLVDGQTRYETAAIAWLETWQTIAMRLESRLRREVLLIEHEIDEYLKEGAATPSNLCALAASRRGARD